MTKRNSLILLIAILTALLYFPLNRSPTGAHILAGSLDTRIPTIQLFAIPYLLMLPIFWVLVAYEFYKGKSFDRLGLALIAIFLTSDLLFVLFPTFMPRPSHTNGLISFIYKHDRPYNDFPSGHAAMATLLVLFYWQKDKWRWYISVFSVLVVASTLFVKQHSLIGALAGVIIAAVSWLSVNKAQPKLLQ